MTSVNSKIPLKYLVMQSSSCDILAVTAIFRMGGSKLYSFDLVWGALTPVETQGNASLDLTGCDEGMGIGAF